MLRSTSIPLATPYRLGPRRYVDAGGCLVRVSEDARLCSVFLGHADPSDEAQLSRIEGTGFFVGHAGLPHLVTAWHVAETLSAGPFAVRLTAPSGIGRVLEIERPRWHRHPVDTTADVAVMLVDAPEWTQTTAMQSTSLINEHLLKYWDIGPGDAAYIVGLFSLFPGKRKNLPIVHAGHIALMPDDERIPVKKKGGGLEYVEAYLVEAHALPGASGSPVMIRPTIRFLPKAVDFVTATDEGETAAIAESKDYLLGVWTAAWPGVPDDEMRKALGLTDRTWIPIGMGIVVPAERILEIIESAELMQERDQLKQKADMSRAARPTGVETSDTPPTAESHDNPNHREDFNRLVSEASKSKPKDDQT